MLDSSPVALGPSMASSNRNPPPTEVAPNPRKLLKRSASTASLASLPTPPRTRRRHARGRSRASVESDSDTYEDRGGDDAIMTSEDEEARGPGDNEHTDNDDEGVAAAGRHHPKRRRVGDARLDAADEEAFWLGGSSIATAGGANTHAGQDPVATSKASQAPLLYRRLQAQATAVSVTLDAAPVSPPPSHRKTAPVAAAAPAPAPAAAVATHKDEEEPASRFSSPSPSPPSTPSRNTRSQTLASTPPPKHARLNALGGKAGAGPLFRDSPDNPFLVTPVKQKGGEGEGGNLDSDTDVRSPSASVTASSADPSPHTPNYGERPTVTYVFRGVRRTYQNPLYNHAENRPYSPPPQSKLPIDHPDYSPSVLCAPKVLFAEARFGHGRGKRHGQGSHAHAEARERTKRAERSASPSPTPGRASFGRKTAIGGGAAGAAGKRGQRGRFRAGSVSGDEDEDDHEGDDEREREIKPKKLDFGAPVGGAELSA